MPYLTQTRVISETFFKTKHIGWYYKPEDKTQNNHKKLN